MRTVRFAARFAALAAVAALAACATTAPPGAEVTRFHLGQPIARATVALVPADPAAAFSLEYRTYAAAVARELAAQNFMPEGNDPASVYVGTLAVTRSSRPAPRRGGVSIGLGGGIGGGYRSGGAIGGGVSVPLGSSGARELISTMLSLQLRRRSDSTMVWEGRASSAVVGAATDLAGTVPVLAHALLEGFPGPAGKTVRVTTR